MSGIGGSGGIELGGACSVAERTPWERPSAERGVPDLARARGCCRRAASWCRAPGRSGRAEGAVARMASTSPSSTSAPSRHRGAARAPPDGQAVRRTSTRRDLLEWHAAGPVRRGIRPDLPVRPAAGDHGPPTCRPAAPPGCGPAARCSCCSMQTRQARRPAASTARRTAMRALFAAGWAWPGALGGLNTHTMVTGDIPAILTRL